MPSYDFECKNEGCHNRVFTIKHGYDESHPTRCPTCGDPIRQIFTAVPAHIKGSGSSADIDKGTPPEKQPSPTRQRIPMKIRDQEDKKLEGGITRRTSYL